MSKRISVSTRTRFEVFKRDGFTCQYCGRSRDEDGVKLHIDHVIAVAEGGTNDPVNLVTACQDCNLGKAAKPLTARAPVPDIAAQADALDGRREHLRALQQRSAEVMEAEDDLTRGTYNYWFDAWSYDSLPTYNTPNRKTLLRYIEAIGDAEVRAAMDVAAAKFGGRIKYGALAYFYGVCKRKVADTEGRVVACVTCRERIILTPEQAAATDDRETWAHGGECAEARNAEAEARREAALEVTAEDEDAEVCPACDGPMFPGLWVCVKCQRHADAAGFTPEVWARRGVHIHDDYIADEVAAWEKLAQEAGV